MSTNAEQAAALIDRSVVRSHVTDDVDEEAAIQAKALEPKPADNGSIMATQFCELIAHRPPHLVL